MSRALLLLLLAVGALADDMPLAEYTSLMSFGTATLPLADCAAFAGSQPQQSAFSEALAMTMGVNSVLVQVAEVDCPSSVVRFSVATTDNTQNQATYTAAAAATALPAFVANLQAYGVPLML